MVKGPLRDVGFWKLSSSESTKSSVNVEPDESTNTYDRQGGLELKKLRNCLFPGLWTASGLQSPCVRELLEYRTVQHVDEPMQSPLVHCVEPGDEDS